MIKVEISIVSIDQNQIIFKFNFYKKNFKKINKKLNLSLKDSKIYISDNLGYLYALDYLKKKYCGQKILKSLLDLTSNYLKIKFF